MTISESFLQWKSDEPVSRDNSYNLVRLLAAAFVVYGHMYVLSGDYVDAWLGIPVHTLGFKMLMVISGYMITQSCIRDGHLGHYWAKRACRILPGLIACVLVCAFVLGPIFTRLTAEEYFKHPATWHYLRNITMYPVYALPGVFEGNFAPSSVNGSLWALPVEVSLYAVIWLVLLVGGRWKYRRAFYTGILFAVCIMQLIRMVFGMGISYVFYGTEWFGAFDMYPFFFLGAAFYILPIRKYCNPIVAGAMLLIGAILRVRFPATFELISYITLPYIIITFGEKSSRISAKIPDITYGIFLWGFPVQQTYIYLCGKNDLHPDLNLGFVICLTITVVFAIISSYTVEKWGTTLGKKLVAPRIRKLKKDQIMA